MAGVYGLSGSGMDVDSMVKGLMKTQRTRQDSMQQKKTQLEWTKAEYNTAYTAINDFRSSAVFTNKMQGNLMPKLVTSNNESVLTLTANADAANLTHTVVVTQLATGVNKSSSGPITGEGKDKTTLASQFTGLPPNFEMTINGKTIMVDSNQSINNLVTRINYADAGVKASYDATMDCFFMYTHDSGKASAIDFTNSSAEGLDFITNKLKLSILPTVGESGVSSATDIAVGKQLADVPTNFSFDIINNSQTVDPLTGAVTSTNPPRRSTVSVNAGTDSLATILTKINEAKDDQGQSLNVQASYDSATDKVTLSAKNPGETLSFSDSDGTKKGTTFLTKSLKMENVTEVTGAIPAVSRDPIKLATNNDLFTQFGLSDKYVLKIKNGTDTASVTIDNTKKKLSMDDVVALINNAQADAPSTNQKPLAKASYDAASGKFSLAATTGTLDFTGSDPGIVDLLANHLRLPSKTQGIDAKFTLDGASLTQPKNSFIISGVKYNLKSVGSATADIASDISKSVAAVKGFVDAYNTFYAKMTAEIESPKYKGYMPLSSDQKADMKESEITAWDLKAKSGLLHNNSILQDSLTAMRDDISSLIVGMSEPYNSAASIGVTTGSWQEGGKLYFDEAKLTDALQNDPEVVSKIFGYHVRGNSHAQDGICVRLYDTLKDVSDKIVNEAGATATSTYDVKSNVAKQINEYSQSMSDNNRRLETIQANYYKKFNAMESALTKINKQSTWLSQQNMGGQ